MNTCTMVAFTTERGNPQYVFVSVYYKCIPYKLAYLARLAAHPVDLQVEQLRALKIRRHAAEEREDAPARLELELPQEEEDFGQPREAKSEAARARQRQFWPAAADAERPHGAEPAQRADAQLGAPRAEYLIEARTAPKISAIRSEFWWEMAILITEGAQATGRASEGSCPDSARTEGRWLSQVTDMTCTHQPMCATLSRARALSAS